MYDCCVALVFHLAYTGLRLQIHCPVSEAMPRNLYQTYSSQPSATKIGRSLAEAKTMSVSLFHWHQPELASCVVGAILRASARRVVEGLAGETYLRPRSKRSRRESVQCAEELVVAFRLVAHLARQARS